jgi:hypothetical protein
VLHEENVHKVILSAQLSSEAKSFPVGYLKVKGKVVPVLILSEHHAIKAYWESGGIVSLIL